MTNKAKFFDLDCFRKITYHPSFEALSLNVLGLMRNLSGFDPPNSVHIKFSNQNQY